jgi:hypothetical protein
MDPGCLSCIGMLFGSLRTGDIRKFCQVTGRESTPRTTAVFNIARGRFSNTEAALATSEGSNLRKRFVFNAITPASAVGTTIVVDLVLRDDNWLASNLVWMPAKGHPMVLMGEVPQAELMALARDARSKKRKHSRPLALKRPLAIGALVAAICLSFYFGVNYFGQRVPSSDAEARASAETMKSGSKGELDLKAGSAKKADADSMTKGVPAAKREAEDAAVKDADTPAHESEGQPKKASESAAHKGERTNPADELKKSRKVQNARSSESSQPAKSSRKSGAGVKTQAMTDEQARTDAEMPQGQPNMVEPTDRPDKSAEKIPLEPVDQTVADRRKLNGQSVGAPHKVAPITKTAVSAAVGQPKKPSVSGRPVAKELSNAVSQRVPPVVKPAMNSPAVPIKQSVGVKSKSLGQAAGVTQEAKPITKPSVKTAVETSQSVSQPAPPPPMPLAPRMPKGPAQAESTALESSGAQPPVPMVNAGGSGQ